MVGIGNFMTIIFMGLYEEHRVRDGVMHVVAGNLC
jgi:hypothetical protein